MAGQIGIFLLSTAGSLGIEPLLQLLAPPAPTAATTTVSVGLGMCNSTRDTCGGNTPGVTLWNERGQFIGQTFGTKTIIPDDQPVVITVKARETVGNDVAYVSITNGGDDAICINQITVSDSVGVTKSISGDVFYLCGADWYPSTQQVSDTGSRPRCIWIDRNRSDGLRFQGLGFHTGSFENFPALAQQYNAHPRSMCGSGPRLKMYEALTTEDPILTFKPPIAFNKDGTDVDLSKIVGNPGVDAEIAVTGLLYGADHNYHRRAMPTNSTSPGSFMQGHVVISAFEEHSAKEVCESSHSRGPDFVSLHEGYHCDMNTRILYEVCSDTKRACCFDVNTSRMIGCNPNVRRRDALSVRSMPVKDYHTTLKWGWE